ncbi:hypothetical protein QAD02_013449 [Eretmocerus hayati]|uniref:Uncharacterized protein n=1 Tax=Eretmocerus hayati TaxID=131215 RepID=A0ACC2P2Q4_9HYME|nr:hypothetical protein QAD02_013449 [Eretmocerus hayati]
MEAHKSTKATPGTECVICEKTVKRDELPQQCAECASLAYLICVPSAKSSSSKYKCPSCVSRNSLQVEIVKSSGNSVFPLSADLSSVQRRRIHSEGNSTHTPSTALLSIADASRISSNSESGVKRIASPPSPSVARDTKLHRRDTDTDNSLESPHTSSADNTFESTDTQIDMGNKKNDDASPSYFANFLERFDERMDGVDSSIQQLDTKISERVNHIESQPTNIQQDVRHVVQNNALIDSAEILVCGLPKQMNMSTDNIISHLFSVLEIPHFANFIISVREWKSPDLSFRKNTGNDPNDRNPDTSSTTTTNPNFYSLVI